MKNSYHSLSAIMLFLSACSHGGTDPYTPVDEYRVTHGEIVLGEQMENPYTVENVKSAIASLYPTKARVELEATDLYVRFLPSDETQFEQLKNCGVMLLDHPIDYKIVREGDYYHDPSLDQEEITWQYAVVPASFEFPDIRHEILDDCYLAENAQGTKAELSDVDWNAVEAEAFRLTGNSDMLDPVATKGGGSYPEGRITIIDPSANGGQPFGIAGVRVQANVFVKFSSTYTDRDGYYKVPKIFSANPRYRLVFKNHKGFSIGFNSILYPASVSTLGRGEPTGLDACISSESDRTLFRRSAVSNATYDYFERCARGDLNLVQPPSDLCIWTFDGSTRSSAIMLHHGTILSKTDANIYLKIAAAIIRFFSPDITLGTSGLDSYREIYSLTMHELAHASHYMKVGNDYWNSYIWYIVSCAMNGQDVYGDGTLHDSGYCAVGEMWAYYLQGRMVQDRYNVRTSFGENFWFHPQIFTFLGERGLKPSDLLDALSADVTDVRALRDELLDLYPSKSTSINQVFNRYE